MSTTTARKISAILNLIVVFAMMFAAPLQTTVQARVWTDPLDYAPGSTVTIRGDNSDGAAYALAETVHVDVVGPNGYTAACDAVVTAGENGYLSWACDVVLWSTSLAYGSYNYTAHGLTSQVVETGVFTDAPPDLEQLWQCDPPSSFNPSTYTCETSSPTGWVTGNNDGPLSEGDTIPYRTRMKNLVSGNDYSITIQWDTTKDSKHAIDYLKTWNATITAANPCLSLTGLPAGLCSTPSTYLIPADTFMQANTDWQENGGVQDPGTFTMYGGTLTGVSAYTTPANYVGDTSTSITLYFTASSSDAVLAWGGHIAERDDWGMNNSAVAIPGSPYHMRILSWYDITNEETLNVGNTDRSLSADAVIYPASITIIKQAVPEGATAFSFTASPAPLAGFTLTDDGTSANTKVFANITNFTTYSVTETVPVGWNASPGVTCSVTSSNGGSQTVASPLVTINLKEGENVTCTYTNTHETGSLVITKSFTAGTSGFTGKFSINYTCTDGTSGSTMLGAGESATITGILTDAQCTVSEPTLPTPPTGWSFGTPSISPAQPVTITKVTNVEVTVSNSITRDQGYLKISKAFDPLTSGFTGTFAIVYNCGAGDVTVDLAAGTSTTVGPFPTGTSCTVSEPTLPTAPTGWTFGTPVVSGSPAVITKGDQAAAVAVSVANSISRDLGNFKITKSVSNPNGATLPAAFTGTYDCGTGYTGTWSVAAGGSQTVSGIPTGNVCSVVEDAPLPIDGYTWGPITYTPATITIETKGGTFEIVVGNSISRDTGSLKILKTLSNPDGASVPASFTVNYNCGTGFTGQVSVAPGSPATVNGIPTGSTCSVTEVAPAAIPGYTWGTISYTPASVTIDTKDGIVEITVGNSITRDRGSLKLSKALTGGPAGYTGPFQINYDCDGTAFDGFVSVAAGSFKTVSGIPTGTSCTISETLPTPPAGYAFGTPAFTPSNVVTISEKGVTVEVTVTNKMGQDVNVTKTATASLNRLYKWTIDKSVDHTLLYIAEGGTATFNYSVAVTPNGYTDSGWTLGGTITITNPNPEAVAVSVVDTLDKGGTCSITEEAPYSVPANATLTLHYTCATDGTTTRNTVNVTWNQALYATPNASASADADVSFTLAGETNKTITVVDDKTDPLHPVTLGTSDFFTGPFTYTYSLEKQGVAGTCTAYTNTAVIDETDQSDSQQVVLCVGKDLTVTKTAAASKDRLYKWLIDKSVDDTRIEIAQGGTATFNYTVEVTPDGYTDSGYVLGGTITIVNPNDFQDVIVDVTDTLDQGGTCAVTEAAPHIVPRSGSLTLHYTCDTDGSTTNNHAAVTWNSALYTTPHGSATADAAMSFALDTETNKTITVVDDKTDPANPVTLGTSDFYAGPFVFSYSLEKQGVAGACNDYTNTAVIDETDQSDSQTVTVCVGKDLTVSKTAVPSFTRTWDWTLVKDYDATYNLLAGQSVTHGYKVTVDPTYTDSAWKVEGDITIANPNAWEAITANVADSATLDGSCVLDDTDGIVSVPASGIVVVHYTCTWATTPTPYSGTNTATITWDKDIYFTPNGLATGTQGFEFKNPTEINPVVTVDDNNLTGESWSADRAYAEWSYGKEFACSTNPADYAGDGTYSYTHTNTATINETTGDSDIATVTVNCFAPVVSKTAAGKYDERHDWTVTKTVSPVSQSAFAGDTVSYEWTVVVTEDVAEENFLVAGEITVVNPSGEEITVDLVDSLGGGTAATIIPSDDCAFDAELGKLTIPANTTAVCAYEAKPAGRADTVNNVSVTMNGITFSNSAAVGWTATVIRGSATLDDDQNPNLPPTITDGGTFTYTEQYTCSTDKNTYDATTHKYTFGENNTATLTSGDFNASSTASTAVDCYVPTISKTANGTYDEVHEWTIDKTVDPGTQSAFAGETKNFTWTVTVGESQHDENFEVTGQITVVNPNPEDALLVMLNDVLNDGSIASITSCSGGTWADPNLTVPPVGTAVCNYSVVPSGNYNLAALAAALPNQVTMSVQYPYTGGPSYFPVTTISGGGALNGSYEGWCVDTEHVIYQNTPYNANVFSSYEALPAGLVDHPENFDLVNWIINQDFVGKPSAGGLGLYTYSDVQYAIWSLIDNAVSNSGLYDLNATRALQIRDAALAHGEGFMPTCGNMIAVVLQPVGGVNQTITIAQVTFASLGVDCADTNVATAVLNGVKYPASAQILWTANPINPTATLDDDQNPAWPEPITVSGAGTFTYQDPQGYTCPSDPAAYTGDGIAPVYTDNNTATITYTGGSKSSSASTSVTCYGPVVTKTASTYFNRDWDWTIVKDYDGSYNLFAGDTVTHNYKVAVTPTYTDNFWGVKGSITVYNYHPTEAMTLASLTDLAGGINGTVTCDNLVVPAAGSLICSYDTGAQTAPNANPFGALNTATAVFASANWTGTAPIVFSATPTTEDEPVITVDDDNLTGEVWSADRTGGEWTYSKDFACSADPDDYTDGVYSFSHLNTAKINETEQTDTANVDVTCYWPQIKLTKTGDGLSKIGDDVTYTIKLENNTPVAASLRDLACTISDALIGFNKSVILAPSASDTSTKTFTIPTSASDPFDNTASVTCKPVAATAPVVGSSTFSVGDTSTWSTNLFQPKVEILKSGPLYATSGDVITYSFTINNLSSADSPNLVLATLTDNVLGDLADDAPAACDSLGYNGTCSFTVPYTVPDAGLQAYTQTNIVSVLYHPDGFPNDITDTDDHTVTVTPRGQLTDTSFCPLANNQFRLLYRLYQAPNVYLLNGSNPGQFYYNAFYFGAPGSTFTMDIEIPYPFMTQEGAGNPIQVHDGTSLTSSGCFYPNPSLSGFGITTEAMTPASSAGNQIITPEDYSIKQIGQTTTVTVSGTVPETGFAYVTIHLDYGLKKTQPWKPTGTFTINPVTGASIGDMIFNNTGPTILGVQHYIFSRAVGADLVTTDPASYNEIKKFAGFLGFVSDLSEEAPVPNALVEIYNPKGAKLATLYTDEDGYYMFLYKHTAKAATYTVKLPNHGRTVSVTVKANGFAAVDFDLP